MKKLWLLLPLILLFIAPAVGAQSKNSKKVEVTSLRAGETIDRNYFAANERVEVDGTVNGDAFIVGGLVDIEGKINGDLLVAGGQVNIAGEVSDDVRVAGGQVRISGKIGKNLTVAGGNVEITEVATVGRSVVVGGGNVTVAGSVGGTINGGAGSFTINNTVGGDVEVGSGDLRLNSKAVINGTLTYWADDEAIIDQKASVTGETIRKTPPVSETPDAEKIFGVIAGFALVLKIISLVSLFILGLLLINFAPGLFSLSIATLKEKPWPSLGFGFLALVATPIVAVLLIVFVLGIPLGLILLALYAIALYVSKIPVIYYIGEWILKRFGRDVHQVWAWVIGLIVYGFLTLIPVLGGLVGFVVALFGLGAWLIAKKQIYTEARKKNLI